MPVLERTSVPNASNILRTTLSNGITVLAYENYAAQSVVISGGLRAGSLLETPATNGLAVLTAEALMRGTQTRSFEQIATVLEDAGADVGVSGGTHRALFFGKALAEDLLLILDVLSDVLRRPTFPAEQVERLRGEILTGLRIRQQDTRYRANRAFHQALFPANHPYHYSARGTIETVSALTAGDLAEFHSRHYGPSGMIIAISGAVAAEEAVNLVRSAFEDWSPDVAATEITLPPIALPDAQRRSAVSLAGKTQADFVLGLPGPSRLSADYLPAMLANSVLGQFGMMGRVGAVVREELGLAYYVYSQLEGGLGPGPWTISAGVNPANLELAIERSIHELRRLATDAISAADLDDNQSYVIGRIPLQLEGNEGIVGALVNMELYDLGLDYLLNLPGQVRGLTTDDVLRAASQYLHPDRVVIGIAGPAD